LDSPTRPPHPGLLPLGNIHHILARPLCTSFTPPYLRVAGLTPTLTPPFFYMTTPPLLFLYSGLRTAASSLDTTLHYTARLAASPPAFRALEPSLRSPYISTAYRTPPRLFLIGLQRKIRIQRLPPHYVVPAVTPLISMATIFSLVLGLRKPTCITVFAIHGTSCFPTLHHSPNLPALLPISPANPLALSHNFPASPGRRRDRTSPWRTTRTRLPPPPRFYDHPHTPFYYSPYSCCFGQSFPNLCCPAS
jgi:hypothetical protein